MCGRYTLFASPEEVARFFSLPLSEVSSVLEQGPRYNIAPTTQVPVVRSAGTEPDRELVLLRWGLIPHWAKDTKSGPLLINARGETVAEKPAFRSSFRYRRCLMIADGFYEWQKLADRKQPHHFRVDGGDLIAFAGIWDRWEPAGGKGDPVESCSIITTQANELAKLVHDRMPVILPHEWWDTWLGESAQETKRDDTLQSLLKPYPAEKMSVVPVSTLVNSPRNDSPDCVAPVGPPLEVVEP